MTKDIHRVPSNTKRGRQLQTHAVDFNKQNIPQEIRDWNAEVERRKHEKRMLKLARMAK